MGDGGVLYIRWAPEHGNCFGAPRQSAELSGGVHLYTVDYFPDGRVVPQEPIVVVDGVTVSVSDLRRVLAHIA